MNAQDAWKEFSKGKYFSDVEEDIFRSGFEAGVKSQGWQPIKTAPKDGTEIDVWNSTTHDRIPNVLFSKLSDNWCDDTGFWATEEDFYKHITHWMPIPKPPENI